MSEKENLKQKEPYLIVSTSALEKLIECSKLLEETVNELKTNCYDRCTLVEENKHLIQQMDLRCDEKNEQWKEISRLKNLLDEAGIKYEEDEDE